MLGILEHVEGRVDQREGVGAPALARVARALEPRLATAGEREPRRHGRGGPVDPAAHELVSLLPHHRGRVLVEAPGGPGPARPRARDRVGADHPPQPPEPGPQRLEHGLARGVAARGLLGDPVAHARGLAPEQLVGGLGDHRREPTGPGVALGALQRPDLAERQPREHVAQPALVGELSQQRLGRDRQRVGDLVPRGPCLELRPGRERGQRARRRGHHLARREPVQPERDRVLADQVLDRARAGTRERVARDRDPHVVARAALHRAVEGVLVARARHHPALAPVRLAARVGNARERAQARRGEQAVERHGAGV